MKNNLRSNKGFTLVEILASVIVLVAVGSVLTGIIGSSLRGTNKTSTIENIRQNGNYALSQMSKTIEYAQTFNGLNTDGGNTYIASCFSASLTPTPPVTQYFIKVTPFNGGSIVYNCSPSSPLTVMSNGVSLVDTDSVLMRSCSITCIQASATDTPIIGISFSLEPKNANNLVENSTPPIIFETSVTLRNYRK